MPISYDVLRRSGFFDITCRRCDELSPFNGRPECHLCAECTADIVDFVVELTFTKKCALSCTIEIKEIRRSRFLTDCPLSVENRASCYHNEEHKLPGKVVIHGLDVSSEWQLPLCWRPAEPKANLAIELNPRRSRMKIHEKVLNALGHGFAEMEITVSR